MKIQKYNRFKLFNKILLVLSIYTIYLLLVKGYWMPMLYGGEGASFIEGLYFYLIPFIAIFICTFLIYSKSKLGENNKTFVVIALVFIIWFIHIIIPGRILGIEIVISPLFSSFPIILGAIRGPSFAIVRQKEQKGIFDYKMTWLLAIIFSFILWFLTGIFNFELLRAFYFPTLIMLDYEFPSLINLYAAIFVYTYIIIKIMEIGNRGRNITKNYTLKVFYTVLLAAPIISFINALIFMWLFAISKL